MSAQHSFCALVGDFPPPPILIPHSNWPYPGLTAEDSARAAIVSSEQYGEMLAAVIKAHRGARMTTQEVLAAVPKDWRDLCGRFAHGNISHSLGQKHGIESIYVNHEGHGFHFEYRAKGTSLPLEEV